MKFPTRPTFRSIVALCCLLALSACRMWEQQPAPAPATGREIRAVRLTLNDGFSVVLKDAVVSGDSIVGTPPETRVRTAVALADVKTTEIQRIDVATTFWTGFLGAVAGLGAFAYVMIPRT